MVGYDRLKNSSLDDVSSSLLHWMSGIMDDSLFTKEFICNDLQVRIIPPPHSSSPADNPTQPQRQAADVDGSDNHHQQSFDTPYTSVLAPTTSIVDRSTTSGAQPIPIISTQITDSPPTGSFHAPPGPADPSPPPMQPIAQLNHDDVTITEPLLYNQDDDAFVTQDNSQNISIRNLDQGEHPTSSPDIGGIITHHIPVPNDPVAPSWKNIQMPKQLNSGNGNAVAEAAGGSPIRRSVPSRDSYADFIMEQSEAKRGYRKLMEQVKEKESEALSLQRDLIEGLPDETGLIQQSPKSKVFLVGESPSPPVSPSHQPIQLRPSHHVTSDQPNRDFTPKSLPDVTLYTPVEKTEDSAVIRSVAFHPKGRAVAIGSNSRVLKLCSVSNRSLSPQSSSSRGPDWMQIIMKKSQVHKGSVYGLAWNAHGNILASCSNDTLLKIYHYNDESSSLQGPQFQLNHHDGMIRDVTFLHGYGSGSVLASGGSSDFVVYTYACDVDTVVHQLSGHSDQVLSLFSWSNGLLASSSQDRSVRMWDLRSSRCTSVLGFGPSSDQHCIPTSVCVDTGGRYMAVGRDDHVISIYDVIAGKAIVDYPVHKGEVRSVRFNPIRPNLLLSSSYDGTAIVTRTDALIRGTTQPGMTSQSSLCRFHSDKVIQARWHPSGRAFATTSADQSCVIWGVTET